MTDNEIIKALECCTNCICHHAKTDTKCPLAVMQFCKHYLMEQCIDIINRQRAEIERLKTENKLLIENDVRNKYPTCVSVTKGRVYTRTLNDYDELIGDISAEAIKEFAERLKEKASMYTYGRGEEHDGAYVNIEYIDNLVKEMEGEQG